MTHFLVERILSGEVPENVKRAAARGALPIPREDLVELWILLRSDEDDDVRLACKESLAEVPESEWMEILPVHDFDPRVFDFAVKVLGKNPNVLQAVLRNRQVPLESLEWLAQNSVGAPIDLMLDNQVRLIGSPSIVVSMLANPNLNRTQVRRLFDLSEQFFRDHPEIPSLLELRFGLTLGIAGGEFRPDTHVEKAEEAVQERLDKETAAELQGDSDAALREALEAEEGALDDIPLEALSEEPLSSEEFQSLYQRILQMGVPQKISLALKGNKEARGLLIRDSNKIVQMAVLDSPKITDSEIEGIAKMRNISDELIRKMARNQDWLKRYSILKALVLNPKTPPGVSIRMVSSLLDLDMKLLMKDKGVSEIIRREARKVWEARHARKDAGYKKH
jgi:hypothetical protein